MIGERCGHADTNALRSHVDRSCGQRGSVMEPSSVLHLRPYREMVFSGMFRNLYLALFGPVMVLMVAISLLASGFAHQPMLNAAQIDQAVYLADLGLTAADLCAEQGDEDGGMVMGDCPACHLSASLLLPEPVASFIEIELRTAAAIFVPADARGFGRSTNPATPVRAPPLA